VAGRDANTHNLVFVGVGVRGGGDGFHHLSSQRFPTVICLLNNKAKGIKGCLSKGKRYLLYNIALCSNKFFPICLALELPEWFLCTDSFVKEAPTEWPPQRCEMTFVKIFGALTCLLNGYMIKTVLSVVRRLFAKWVL
jgi:hypothetical protein